MRARRGSEAVHGTHQFLARHGVDGHVHALAAVQVGQLRFLEVGGDPDVVLHDGRQLLARLHAHARFHVALADAAGDGRQDTVVLQLLFRVLQLHAQHGHLCLGHVARSLRRADLRLGGRGAVAAGGQVGHGAGAGRVGRIEFRFRDGFHLARVQLAIALGILLRTQQLRVGLRHLRLGRARLRLHLRDLRVRLQHLLLGAGDLRGDLLGFHALVEWIEFSDHVALFHHLIIVDEDLGDDAGNARRDRVHVAGDIGVFRFHEIVAAVPHARAGAQGDQDDQAGDDFHAVVRCGGAGRCGGRGRCGGGRGWDGAKHFLFCLARLVRHTALRNEMISVHYWTKKRQSQEMKRLHFILICTTV